jgi:hypothetical protein
MSTDKAVELCLPQPCNLRSRSRFPAVCDVLPGAICAAQVKPLVRLMPSRRAGRPTGMIRAVSPDRSDRLSERAAVQDTRFWPGNGGVPMATLVRPRQGKIIAGCLRRAGQALRHQRDPDPGRLRRLRGDRHSRARLPDPVGGHAKGARVASPTCSPRRVSNGDLPITRRMLGVDLDGSRRIWAAHVGCLVGPDGSRRIQKDRLKSSR